jgi:hypothetical protein
VASRGGRTLEESRRPRQVRVIAGEGMLVATADGDYTDEYGRHEIKAGITRVAPDHPLAKRRPEAFRVAWRDDVVTAHEHRANLLARMAELRGEATSPATRLTARPAWYIG